MKINSFFYDIEADIKAFQYSVTRYTIHMIADK